jgi:hypothetical protein
VAVPLARFAPGVGKGLWGLADVRRAIDEYKDAADTNLLPAGTMDSTTPGMHQSDHQLNGGVSIGHREPWRADGQPAHRFAIRLHRRPAQCGVSLDGRGPAESTSSRGMGTWIPISDEVVGGTEALAGVATVPDSPTQTCLVIGRSVAVRVEPA